MIKYSMGVVCLFTVFNHVNSVVRRDINCFGFLWSTDIF